MTKKDETADSIENAEVRILRVGTIKVDAEIQRYLDRPRAQRIADDYDPDAVGIITVSERADGIYVVDGQHRVAGVVLARGENTPIQARVMTGLSRAEEARLFRRLNTTKKPLAFDLFRSRLVEEDKKALAIQDIYTRHGWVLGFGTTTGIAAVAAMERVYDKEPLALDKALYVATKAWGYARESVDGRVIEGLGLFFWRHGDTAVVDDLIGKLATHTGGSLGVIGRANTIRELTRKPLPRSMATYLTDLYNKGKKTRALAPFDNK